MLETGSVHTVSENVGEELSGTAWWVTPSSEAFLGLALSEPGLRPVRALYMLPLSPLPPKIHP